MLPYESKAAALRYDATTKTPLVVASGMGYTAEKIMEVAASHQIPIYQDNSLATLLSQLQSGTEIPPELYQAIVDIYVYFLKYSLQSDIKNGTIDLE